MKKQFVKIFSIVSIVIILAAVAMAVTQHTSFKSRQSEIADVLSPLLEAQKATFEIGIGGQMPELFKVSGMYEFPSKSRLDIGGQIVIWNDLSKRKTTLLNRIDKTVSVGDIQAKSKMGFDLLTIRNILESMINSPNTEVKKIGRKMINGNEAAGYEIKNDSKCCSYWVNPMTNEPVEINLTFDELNAMEVRISSINIAPAINEDLFEIKIPDGYATQKLDPLKLLTNGLDSTDTNSITHTSNKELGKKSKDLLELSNELMTAINDYRSIPANLTIKKKAAKEKMSSLKKEVQALSKEVQALAKEAGSSATEDQNKQ